MKGYPEVLSEMETLEYALKGRSLARLGDGELRLATGGRAASQEHHLQLELDLKALLNQQGEALVCIPPVPRAAKPWFWQKYYAPKFTSLYRCPPYGSTWVTRPDDAPNIDRPEYWYMVKQLWALKDVVLVTGDEKSLTPDLMQEAHNVRVVMGPRQHAYSEIDRLEEEVGLHTTGPVILCLGATATVLAERLARKDMHALDLGHIGMFMRRKEKLERMRLDDVASPEYVALLKKRYEAPGWGSGGHHHAIDIADFARKIGAETILDYGCGRGKLKPELDAGFKVSEFDPGIIGKDTMPRPADLVVATDVLEHVEKDRLKNVLDHIKRLARKGMYLVIGCGPAKEVLPDGRNAHLIQMPPAWWLAQLNENKINVTRSEVKKGLRVWAIVR